MKASQQEAGQVPQRGHNGGQDEGQSKRVWLRNKRVPETICAWEGAIYGVCTGFFV